MYTSVETKGIQGNDKRNYVLDLLRTMPPDVNFLGGSLSDEDKAIFCDEAKELQFPRAHTHKLAAHRFELMEAFCENRYLQYWRLAMKSTAEMKKRIEAEEISDEVCLVSGSTVPQTRQVQAGVVIRPENGCL